MSRVLHVDASQGASGDMILGALVDLGVPLAALTSALARLPVGGFRLEARRIERATLCGTKLDVILEGPDIHGRNFREVSDILDGAALDERVQRRARAVFRRLFEAEAQVHGAAFEEVHLHEAGAVDAIVDIVGACLGLDHLAVDRLVVSTMTTGFGEVHCSHGVFAVPAPATALLVRGAPVQGGSIEAERLTPTGAAILTTLADAWGPLPAMRPSAVGHGAGSRDLGQVPNMLRLTLGSAEEPIDEAEMGQETVAVIECTIDDQTPQALAFAAQRLLDAGCLDVFTSSVTMKKGRLGHHLSVLARPHDRARLCDLVLRQTTTLGLRWRLERRIELSRSTCRVQTRYGEVEVKVGTRDGEVLQVWPEYEQCAELAQRHGASLWDVQQAALAAYAAPGE